MNFQKLDETTCTFQDNRPNSYKVGELVTVNDGGPWSTARVRVVSADLEVSETGYHKWTFVATYNIEQAEQPEVRYINKNAIHAEAVKLGRESKNNMKRTANRLAKCNVDKQIESIISALKPQAWLLDNETIIKGCASRLWIEFCQAEINTQKSR